MILVLIFINHFSFFVHDEKELMPNNISNMVCFCNFKDNGNRYLTSQGKYGYTLGQMNGPILNKRRNLWTIMSWNKKETMVDH